MNQAVAWCALHRKHHHEIPPPSRTCRPSTWAGWGCGRSCELPPRLPPEDFSSRPNSSP